MSAQDEYVHDDEEYGQSYDRDESASHEESGVP